MFRLTKEFRFEASHQLPAHDGKCARLHGHSWRGRVVVRGDVLVDSGPKVGMLLDYGDIKRAVEPLVREHLDHWHLNDSTGLLNPTSEELARWVFERLRPALPMLEAVIIEETCTSSCEYRID
jgi:6-pyruvoyltetrahydropterin/6-carboxytetrahydropterin synthase